MCSKTYICINPQLEYVIQEVMIPTIQRLSLCQRSVYFSAAKVFNELPVSLSSLTNLSAFKRSVKKFLLGDGSNVSYHRSKVCV